MAKDEGMKESETVLNQPENQRFVLRDHDGNKKLSVREVPYRRHQSLTLHTQSLTDANDR